MCKVSECARRAGCRHVDAPGRPVAVSSFGFIVSTEHLYLILQYWLLFKGIFEANSVWNASQRPTFQYFFGFVLKKTPQKLISHKFSPSPAQTSHKTYAFATRVSFASRALPYIFPHTPPVIIYHVKEVVICCETWFPRSFGTNLRYRLSWYLLPKPDIAKYRYRLNLAARRKLVTIPRIVDERVQFSIPGRGEICY